MQDVTLKITPAKRALIRRALPYFVNFMRFLHPGQACAAKFASSTALLGWDGSLLHCKSPGWVVPSFGQRLVKTMHFPWPNHLGSGRKPSSSGPDGPISRLRAAIWTPGRRETSTRFTGSEVPRRPALFSSPSAPGPEPWQATAPDQDQGERPGTGLPDPAGCRRVHGLALGAAKGLAELIEVLH